MSARTVELVGTEGTRLTLACSTPPDFQLGVTPGLHGPATYSIASRRVANIPGERPGRPHAEPRLLPITVVVNGTEAEQDDKIGTLGRILSPPLENRIIYTRPDGTKREITAVCLNSSVRIDHAKTRAAQIQLLFKAFRPYWRAVNENIGTYTADFVDHRQTGGVNTVEVTNGGDVDTWPEITISGYSENVEAVNLETGQLFRLTRIVEAGETVRIETDPDRGSAVWINDQLDYRNVMSTTAAEFWPLVPGLNRLLLRAAGQSSGAAPGDFTIRWVERFETC